MKGLAQYKKLGDSPDKKRYGDTMKKFLVIGIPIVVAMLLVVAYAAPSFGWGRSRSADAHDFMMYRLDRLSKTLNLDAAQQSKLDGFKTDLSSMMQQRQANRENIRKAIASELSKDNPDINKVMPLIDQQIDQSALAAHDMVSKVSDLYSTLSPEQKKLLADEMLKRIQEH
jgi:Spy/CpxP family protein refolding chaperone